ncbi:MAG: hypothetical protein KGH98_03505 [Candidatus Micrarchaeota archaeon]|nr:hypothetical protein [Candidatus Micrarchaeota archaeon]
MRHLILRELPAFGLVSASFLAIFLATSSFGAVIIAIPVYAIFLAAFRATSKSSDVRLAHYALFSHLSRVYIELRHYGRQLSAAFGTEAMAEPLEIQPGLSRTLNEIGKRMRFGEDLPIAIAASSKRSNLWVTGRLERISMLSAIGNDITHAIRDEAARLEKELMEREIKLGGSIQKYLTAGMVISTVLPSFAVFSMVGYSMLYYSLPAVSAFALLMLAVLPLVYASFRNYLGALYGI